VLTSHRYDPSIIRAATHPALQGQHSNSATPVTFELVRAFATGTFYGSAMDAGEAETAAQKNPSATPLIALGHQQPGDRLW